MLGVILKSTAFTFGTLLSIYLAGIGAGAAVGSLVARRSRGPSRAFLIVQAAIGVYVALTIAIMAALFGRAQAPGWLLEYVARYESLDVRASVPRIFDASHDRSTLVDINTDLHPKDEFALSLGSEG